MKTTKIFFSLLILSAFTVACAKQHSSLQEPSTNASSTTSDASGNLALSGSYADPILLGNVKKLYVVTAPAGLGLVGTLAEAVAQRRIETAPPAGSPGVLSPPGKLPSPLNDESDVKYFFDDDSPPLPDHSAIESKVPSPALPSLPPRPNKTGSGTLAIEFYGEKLTYDNDQVTLYDSAFQHINITQVEDVKFDPGESSALLVTKQSDPFVKNILDSPANSIVRGTTEFRLLKQENGVALLFALNIKPVLRESTIAQSIDKDAVFLPPVTFRNDPLFSKKKAFVTGMGKHNIILDENQTGTVPGSGLSTLHYTVTKKLGSGTYGTVYLVKVSDGTSSFDLAIKQPNDPLKIADTNDQYNLIQEMSFLDAMSRHPNGMQMYGSYPIGGGNHNIVLEVVDGDWNRAIEKPVTFDQETRMITGAADAYTAMHAAYLVHYDTKPANLFYAGDRGVLGDYGFSRFLESDFEIPAVTQHGTYVPIDLLDLGVPKYGDPYAVDTFAYGLSVLQLRGGINFFSDDASYTELQNCCLKDASQRTWEVINGENVYSHYQSRLSPSVKDEEKELIQEMLSNDPAKRPPMSQVAQRMRQIYQLNNM